MRELNKRPLAAAKLVGGRLCLDFVNTVGGRRYASPARKAAGEDYGVIDERLLDYLDLVAWSVRAGLLGNTEVGRLAREAERRPTAAANVWRRAVALREAIHGVSAAIVAGAAPEAGPLEVLNRELEIAHGRVRLAVGASGRFVWEWIDKREALDQMLWPIADSAAEMLTTADLTRLRRCGGNDCGWLFEDTSRNRSRQWCRMQDCGNLSKVRRFRSRVRKLRKRNQRGA